MAIGLVGRKCGMTRIFTDAGVSVPVTVIEVDPNRITQIKTLETDGYQAIQITTGERRESRVTNAQKGHFAKAGVAAGRLVQEFRATEADLEGREVGGTLTVELFQVGQVVDVTGQSLSHRVLGSTGQNQTPGRVFKGKKMAGHLGAERVTTQGLEIVAIDTERSVLVVKGAVPGATGGDVIVRPTIKA